MRYVDAGYVIVLTTLAVYAVSLVVRRRRLERTARLVADGPPGDPATAAAEAVVFDRATTPVPRRQAPDAARPAPS